MSIPDWLGHGYGKVAENAPPILASWEFPRDHGKAQPFDDGETSVSHHVFFFLRETIKHSMVFNGNTYSMIDLDFPA